MDRRTAAKGQLGDWKVTGYVTVRNPHLYPRGEAGGGGGGSHPTITFSFNDLDGGAGGGKDGDPSRTRETELDGGRTTRSSERHEQQTTINDIPS